MAKKKSAIVRRRKSSGGYYYYNTRTKKMTSKAAWERSSGAKKSKRRKSMAKRKTYRRKKATKSRNYLAFSNRNVALGQLGGALLAAYNVAPVAYPVLAFGGKFLGLGSIGQVAATTWASKIVADKIRSSVS
jgi:hypothetical protein